VTSPGRRADRFSVSARFRSLVYATRGIRIVLRTQHNAWIHATVSAVVVLGGLALRIDRSDWIALVLAMVAVWTAESLNTAFEFLADVASPGLHPMVATAKDVAAGAVLISATGAGIVGLLVFVPRVLKVLP